MPNYGSFSKPIDLQMYKNMVTCNDCNNSFMQFKIPQDVQIEDKIIGPITMRQLIILGIGGGITYAIYISLASKYSWPVWGPPVGILSLLTLAISFAKINEMSFTEYVLFYILYQIRARKRCWQQMGGDVFVSSFTQASAPAKKEKKIIEKQKQDTLKITKLDDLTRILDTHGGLLKEKQEKHEKLNEFLNSKPEL